MEGRERIRCRRVGELRQARVPRCQTAVDRGHVGMAATGYGVVESETQSDRAQNVEKKCRMSRNCPCLFMTARRCPKRDAQWRTRVLITYRTRVTTEQTKQNSETVKTDGRSGLGQDHIGPVVALPGSRGCGPEHPASRCRRRQLEQETGPNLARPLNLTHARPGDNVLERWSQFDLLLPSHSRVTSKIAGDSIIHAGRVEMLTQCESANAIARSCISR